MPSGVVADVCTGSGCIALALAQEGRYDRVIGVDSSVEALTLARENAERTGLRVDWRQGDLSEPLEGERLDVLVANPPYLTRAEYDALGPEVRAWEPRVALESGEDGLGATRRLLVGGRGVVKPGGWIALEVDCDRAAAVARLAAGSGWIAPAVYRDLYDRARYVLARRSETS
jgi:release factor glutamine methyltransferase